MLSRRESRAIERNLRRKEKKIGRLWKGIFIAFLGMLGFAGIAFFSNIVANRVAHIATGTNVKAGSNRLLSLEGEGVIETSTLKSFVPLADLSRASLEYLQSTESVTVVGSDRFIHNFAVRGFTLYDQDALDLRTSTADTIEIRCGNVRIKWSDGRLEDAEEISAEGNRARRSLKAASSLKELQHVHDIHVRRLGKFTNPLQSLHNFFGGMAKSTADSTLYGDLAPASDCKMPARLISIVRPTIPEHSKWVVDVRSNGERPDQRQPDVWYMSWDEKNTVPKLRFESPTEECRKHVTISTTQHTYMYHQMDVSACTVMGKTADHIPCPDQEVLANMSIVSCDDYKRDFLAAENELLYGRDGIIEGCKVESGNEESGDLKVSILDAFTDGSSVWQVGYFSIKVNRSGTITAIRPLTGEGPYYDVINIKAFDAAESQKLFAGCDGPQENGSKQRRLLKAPKRELCDLLCWFQRLGTGTTGAEAEHRSRPRLVPRKAQ